MKILATLLFLLASSVLLAQQFNVSISENMELDGKPPLKVGDSYFLLDAGGKAQFGYTYKLNKTKFSAKLLKYDKNLKVTKEVKLANGERVYGPFEPMLKIINDKIFFLYYQLGEDENIKLMSSEVDPLTLALSEPDELIAIEQKNIGLMQAMDLVTSNHLVLTWSTDYSKMLALWSSGINNQIYFSVLDKNLKKIRGASEVIKEETKIEVSNACIDNEGNVFISYNNSKKKSPHILISKLDGKDENLELKIGNGEVYEAFVFRPTTDNAIKIAGTYKESKDNLSGVFSQTLTISNLQLSDANKTAFPQQLVEQFDNDGWATTKSKNYGLSDNLNFIPISLEDGTVDLVGEFRRVEFGTKTSFMIAGDILDIHFKSDGVVFSRIPKARVSAGSDIGDSFFPVPYKSQVIIFYNDHESNVKQDITKSPSRSDNYKNSVLVAASVATDGSIKRDILIDLSREDYLPIAETLQRLSLSSVLIPIRRIKGFGKVTDDFKWGIVDIK